MTIREKLNKVFAQTSGCYFQI